MTIRTCRYLALRVHEAGETVLNFEGIGIHQCGGNLAHLVRWSDSGGFSIKYDKRFHVSLS